MHLHGTQFTKTQDQTSLYPKIFFLQLHLFIFLHTLLLIHIMSSVMYGGPEMYVIFYASEITL